VAEDVVGELENKCVVQPVSNCVVSVFLSLLSSVSPAAGGFVPLL
jgi:hypothetical protein